MVDISDPRNMRLVRDIPIPGTVQAFGVAVDGDVAVVTAIARGVPERLARLRRQRRARHARPERPGQPAARPHRSPGRRGARHRLRLHGRGRPVRVRDRGTAGDHPTLYLLNADDPDHPVFAGIDAPAALQGISGGDNLVFTTDQNSLIVYQILASPGIPVTARVQVPNNTGVAVVPGSFSVAPSQVIPGPDFDTLVFDLALTAANPEPDDHLADHREQPPAGRGPRGHAGIDDRLHQPGHGRPALAAAAVVAAEQILALDPATQTVRPGEAASYTLTLTNPTATAVTYSLSAQGVPAGWVSLASQITVAAQRAASVPLTLTSGAFDPLGEFGFTIAADTNTGTSGSVQGSLVLEGIPLVPAADPEAHGVVLSVTPGQAVAGQGTAANFVVRVVNTGSGVETFTLSTTLPPGVAGVLGQTSSRSRPARATSVT